MSLGYDIFLLLSMTGRFLFKVADQFLMRPPYPIILLPIIFQTTGLNALADLFPILCLLYFFAKLRYICQFLIIL